MLILLLFFPLCPFNSSFLFISEGREGWGGGKVQDLILSIYIDIRQKMKSFLVIVVFPRIDRTRQLALFFFHFLFWIGGGGIRGTNQEKGKDMTIKIIGSGRVQRFVCKLFSFFLIFGWGVRGQKGSCLYSRRSDWSKYYCCVDTWTHSYNKLGPRTRRDIECFGTCTFLFVKCFFGSNKISPLSLDKQASPHQNKGGQKGKEKGKEKNFPFPLLLIQISLPSVRHPFCLSVLFLSTPPTAPFSTYNPQYTYNPHTVTHTHAHAVSCPAEGNLR